MSGRFVGNNLVDHSNVVGASRSRRCSNYIFILDLTPGFNGLGKGNCKTRRESFEFGDLVWLILEILWYSFKIIRSYPHLPWINELSWIFFLTQVVYMFTFSAISWHWDRAGSLNRSSCVTRSLLTRLTDWGRGKMAAIFQTTISNAISWVKMYEFRLGFHWRLFL